MTVRNVITRLIALAALPALAACASQTTIYKVDYDPIYSPLLMQKLTENGELATVVRGNPVGDPREVNAGAIADQLKSPQWFTKFRFTTEPGPATRKDYRIVLVFNPVHPAPGGPAICETNGDIPVKPGETRVRVQAAFCYNDDAITQLFAEAPTTSDLQDPRFDAFMRQTIAALLPQRNPEDPSIDVLPSWWKL